MSWSLARRRPWEWGRVYPALPRAAPEGPVRCWPEGLGGPGVPDAQGRAQLFIRARPRSPGNFPHPAVPRSDLRVFGGPRRTVPLRGDLARSPPASPRSQERNAGPEGVNNVPGGHSKLGTWGRSQGGVSAGQVGEGRVSSSRGREGRQKERGPGHPSLGSLDTLLRVLR